MLYDKRGIQELNGQNVVTWIREFYSCNSLRAEAGTNGYKGGDTGHGSRTYLRLTNIGCSDMQVRALGTEDVEICFGGDTELHTLKKALRWMLWILEVQSETGAREFDDEDD